MNLKIGNLIVNVTGWLPNDWDNLQMMLKEIKSIHRRTWYLRAVLFISGAIIVSTFGINLFVPASLSWYKMTCGSLAGFIAAHLAGVARAKMDSKSMLLIMKCRTDSSSCDQFAYAFERLHPWFQKMSQHALTPTKLSK